jgi:hypothetical protein
MPRARHGPLESRVACSPMALAMAVLATVEEPNPIRVNLSVLPGREVPPHIKPERVVSPVAGGLAVAAIRRLQMPLHWALCSAGGSRVISDVGSSTSRGSLRQWPCWASPHLATRLMGCADATPGEKTAWIGWASTTCTGRFFVGMQIVLRPGYVSKRMMGQFRELCRSGPPPYVLSLRRRQATFKFDGCADAGPTYRAKDMMWSGLREADDEERSIFLSRATNSPVLGGRTNLDLCAHKAGGSRFWRGIGSRGSSPPTRGGSRGLGGRFLRVLIWPNSDRHGKRARKQCSDRLPCSEVGITSPSDLGHAKAQKNISATAAHPPPAVVPVGMSG